jgi:hypothetical protein
MAVKRINASKQAKSSRKSAKKRMKKAPVEQRAQGERIDKFGAGSQAPTTPNSP